MNKLGLWVFLAIWSPIIISAQDIAIIPADFPSNPTHHHEAGQSSEEVWQEVFRRNPPQAKIRSSQKLIWPVRQAEGYDYLDIYALSGYVDHDEGKPNQLRDYNCGQFTYDNNSSNHHGTDIMLWPFGWTQMDRDQAQVIAAAGGEIIEKVDGNYDRNCPYRFVFGKSNAVFIRHDDGTTAIYLSLKEGSLTGKAIGERVAQGEYLGLVGSSGNSRYPHLHFELRSAEGDVIDPFSGPCNPVDSYWQNQLPYLESGINLLSTSLNRPDFNNLCNPADYAPQEEYVPGDSLFFLAFARQVKQDQPLRMRVIMPDGNPLTDRTNSVDFNSFRAYFLHGVQLPDAASGGVYTCILNYEGEEYRTTFTVRGYNCPTPNAGDLIAEVYSYSEAKLTFEGERSATYDWQIRRSGTATWSDIPTEAYSFYLRGLQSETTYEYRVRYWCDDEWSAWSPIAQFTTPANLSCPVVSLDQTTVTFPDLTRATITIDLAGKDRYDWRILAPEGQWANVISQTNNAYTFEGLLANTTYQYRVRVRCGDTWSNWSDIGSFTTPAAEPCAPPTIADFTATPVSATEALFAALQNDKERYDWRLKPVGSSTWITIPSTPATDLIIQSLEPGVTYEIQHRWICTNAWSNWSETLLYDSPATPCPGVPLENITVNFPGEGLADISITIDQERTAFQFRYRQAGNTNWSTLSATSQSTIRIPIVPGTDYDIQVRAFCNDNWSSWSTSFLFTAPVIAVCPSVSLNSTSVDLLSATEVRIRVNPPAEITNIDLRLRANNTTTWTEVNSAVGDDFLLSGLTPNTTYAFEVQGQCSSDTSAWSNTGFFTTLPQAVCLTLDTTSFTAEVLSAEQIQVEAIVDTAQEYQWQYRAEGNTTWTLLPATVSPQALLNNLASGQRYAIQMRQECTNNVWSDWSPTIWRRTALPYTCPAPEERDVTVFNIQHDQVTFLYTGDLGTLLQWRFRESEQNTWSTLPSTTAPTQVTPKLLPETQYEYQLRIDCGQGWSAWSTVQTFSTLPPPAPCNSPETNQINTVLLPSIRAVRIFVEGIDAEKYRWRLRRAGQEVWMKTGESSNDSWTLESLSGETTYELQVGTWCNQSWSDWSNVQEFTTPIHVTCAPPQAGQINITNILSQSAMVQVSAADAVMYSVQYRPVNSIAWTTPEAQPGGMFQLSDLLDETTYEVRFRYECDAGWSTWSSAILFTTLANTLCSDPTLNHIQVTDTTPTEILFHITGLNASGFQIQYREAGVDTWQPTVQRTDSTLRITNLTAQTSYEYRFRYACTSSWSEWSPVSRIHTPALVLGPCAQPVASTLHSGLSHLVLQWHGGSGVQNTYEVRFRDIYAPNWQVFEDITDTILAVSALEPCTPYEWQVRSVCDTGRLSDWSVLQNGSTSGCAAQYCYSYGLGRSAYIDAVTINGSRHESGNDYGYANHTSQGFRMPADAMFDLAVTGVIPAHLPQADNFYWRIWLDRNQDGDFQDSGELLLETTTLTSESLATSTDLQLTASSTPYRLRLGLSTERYPQVCAVEGHKYIEDYELFIDLAQDPIRFPPNMAEEGLGNLSPLQVDRGSSPAVDAGFPFPNPFFDHIRLPVSVQTEGSAIWHLYNVHGRLMRSQNQFLSSGIHTLSLPTQDLPPGSYTLLLIVQEQRKIFRLVKTE